MKLRFIISKLANFFFFIDNLSEWNIYYRKRYNEEWIKQFGKLTRQEKIALKHFRLIMQKYERTNTPKKIRSCFYQKSDNIEVSFKKITKLLNKKEVNILKNSLDVFQPRFEKIWNESQTILSQNQRVALSAYKKMNKKINLAYSKLENFFGDKLNRKYLCNVFFIMSPSRGGKAIRRDVVSIETEKLDPKDKYHLTRLWFSIMHELTHVRFENKRYKNWLKKFLKRKIASESKLIGGYEAKEVLREIITDLTKVALFHLLKKEDKIKAKNYKYRKDSKISDLSSLEKLTRQELGSTIQKYFLTKRKIDINFLEKCWKLIEKYS